MRNRKITQIFINHESNDLTALCSDGTIWVTSLDGDIMGDRTWLEVDTKEVDGGSNE